MTKNNLPHRNTTGRPVREAHIKKKYIITFKVNTQQYYGIKGKAKDANMSVSDYIRRCAMGATVMQRITVEQAGYIRKLCGIANNLNQIARKANAAGYIEAQTECVQISKSIDTLITRINDCQDNQSV